MEKKGTFFNKLKEYYESKNSDNQIEILYPFLIEDQNRIVIIKEIN